MKVDKARALLIKIEKDYMGEEGIVDNEYVTGEALTALLHSILNALESENEA